MKQSKRRGRPPVERRRVPMTMRVTPTLHDEIAARAEETGRSLTQEAELLLEHAVVSEKTMGSKSWRLGIIVTLNFRRAIDDVSMLEEKDKIWEPLNDPNIYRDGLIRSITVLAESEPDIEGLFAAVRERIEQRRGRPPLSKSTLQAMVDHALERDQ